MRVPAPSAPARACTIPPVPIWSQSQSQMKAEPGQSRTHGHELMTRFPLTESHVLVTAQLIVSQSKIYEIPHESCCLHAKQILHPRTIQIPEPMFLKFSCSLANPWQQRLPQTGPLLPQSSSTFPSICSCGHDGMHLHAQMPKKSSSPCAPAVPRNLTQEILVAPRCTQHASQLLCNT